jgi:ubiquinol-cytochrome c reductase cytochrome b subunit
MLVEFVRGGPQVGQATLGRFFTLHVIVLPLALGGLIGAHLYLIRRLGIAKVPSGSEPCPAPPVENCTHEEHKDGIPFFPNYVVKEIGIISLFLAALSATIFFAPTLFFPEAAFSPADPFITPEGIKPEWYFLWAYQTLKVFPSEFLGLAAQGIFITMLALLPFWDRTTERNPLRRPVFITAFGLCIILLVALSIWGHYS